MTPEENARLRFVIECPEEYAHRHATRCCILTHNRDAYNMYYEEGLRLAAESKKDAKMNLKLKIEEVEEVTRPITLEEECMVLIRDDNHYTQSLRDDVRKRLTDLGFVKRVNSTNALFSKKTTRDATINEIRAWHYLETTVHCFDTNFNITSCDDCLFEKTCISRVDARTAAEQTLLNKKVTMELTQ